MLHNGDIDVALPTEAARDSAQAIPSTKEFKIFKKDYLVEIPGVPITVPVAEGRAADNSRLTQAICEAEAWWRNLWEFSDLSTYVLK